MPCDMELTWIKNDARTSKSKRNHSQSTLTKEMLEISSTVLWTGCLAITWWTHVIPVRSILRRALPPVLKLVFHCERMSQLYLRYYLGHNGKLGHELVKFEFHPDGESIFKKFNFYWKQITGVLCLHISAPFTTLCTWHNLPIYVRT